MFVSKKLGRCLVAMCALVLTMGTMWAQNITVTGKVSDKNGEPVVGAYVLIDGTKTGATTDVNGVYKISVPAQGNLLFTCMGYKDTKVAVNGRSAVDVILAEDAMLLENAVVVGFGTQKKENLTGAVASIDAGKQLESRPIADVGRGLQGATPGLNVRVGSTEVGSDAIIRIRGQVGSYQGSASPLILLDNVEIPSLNLINPDDVESISVLKDAASASIYGAKAAFGVILINSKKGSKDDNITINYNGNVSLQNIVNTQGIADVEGLHYSVEAFERTGGTIAGAFWMVDRSSYNAAKAWKAKYADLDPMSPLTYGRDFYVDTRNYKMGVRTYNPYDYLVRKNAPTQNHSVSIAGTTGKTKFNIGLGYLDQKGMMKCTDYDYYRRFNANVRVNTQINDFLNVHAGLMYTNSTKSWAFATSSTTADVWYYLYRWGSIYPLVPVDEYGNNVRTAAYELATAHQATIKTSYAQVNTGATVTPVKNWNINIDYTYANNNTQETNPGIRYWAGNTWSAAKKTGGAQIANEWASFNGLGSMIDPYALSVEDYTSTYDSYYQDSYTSQRQTWNVTTDYSLNIKDAHKFNFLLGMNAVDYKYTGVWGKKMTLLDINNPQFALATGTQTSGGSNSWSSTLGFFGRINYNYKERYLFEANLRYDGTSKFPKNLKWQWFPSFSAGWRLSEEPWMQGAKSVLSSAKIRASWGSIGDQSVASSLYIPTIGSLTTYWQHSGVKDMAYATPGLVASDISWQRIETLDFGIDFSLFNQVNVTFDWYRRTTKDMIVGMEGLSYNVGASAPQGNYGQLHTDGWEVSLNYGHLFDNGFSLSATATLADAVTTIDKYGSAASISGWYNGKTYGEIWGYQVDRIFQNDDFARDAAGKLIKTTDKYGSVYQFADGKNYATQGKVTSGSLISGPGDFKYKDLNGDGVIDNGKQLVDDHGDLTVIGNTTPRYEYSFRADMNWYGFDLSIFFQGIGKRDMWGSSSLTLPGFNTGDGAMAAAFANDFWYETIENGTVVDANYTARYPRAANTGNGGAILNTVVNDNLLLDMSYLRLKNVTFGYTIPAKITKKALIQKFRAYVSLENMLTFDHLNGLPIDVEEISGYSLLNSDNYNSSRAGVGAPAFKSASFGIQLTF